jgi:hypothetical protein
MTPSGGGFNRLKNIARKKKRSKGKKENVLLAELIMALILCHNVTPIYDNVGKRDEFEYLPDKSESSEDDEPELSPFSFKVNR